MNKTGKKRAAGYARFSTDNQDINSIEFQDTRIREWCLENDYYLTKVYKDEAKSGTNINREDFRNLCTAAKRKEFDAVVIYDISRGSRDVADWFAFRKTMQSLDIEVVAIESKVGDLMNPSDFLVELLDVGIGQHHVLVTREKTIEGVTNKAKQAVFLGGCPPIGYNVEDGKYVINKKEAKIVKNIFAWYAAGKSYSYIIDQLKGIKGKKGRPFSKSSLYAILRNDRYIGIYTWNRKCVKNMGKWAGGVDNPNKVVIPDAIPRIISDELWHRVEERIKMNKRSGHKAKREYLLTGLIVCNKCGSRYVGHTNTNNKGYESSSYICGGKHARRNCDAKNINKKQLESFVIDSIKNYLQSTDLQEEAHRLAMLLNNRLQDFSLEQKELIEVSTKIQNATKAILSGLSYPELMDEVNILRERKEELESVLQKVNEKSVSEESILEYLKNCSNQIDTNQKEAVQNFVKQIYAQPNGDCVVELGVHSKSSGDAQCAVCATYIYKRPA